MPPVTAPEIIHATVQAGTIETPYRRAGHGPTLLLLSGEDDGDAADAPLFAVLSTAFRVIAPRPVMAEDGPAWLRDVMDGLGLTRAILVAAPPFAAAAQACARDDPDRIHRLILMDEDDPESIIPHLLD